MTDLEIVQLCADAMDYSDVRRKGDKVMERRPFGKGIDGIYWPLEDDAQAMALVKKFKIQISSHPKESRIWWAWCNDAYSTTASDPDLLRAICECVAKMQRLRSL